MGFLKNQKRAILHMSGLDRIGNWMEQVKAAHFKSDELARLCKISPSQLRRYFAATFGETPERLIRNIRLCLAAHLVWSSRSSIKEIAAELYFRDDSQLCHQFKDHFGCWPSQFPKHYLRGDFGPIAPWQLLEDKLGLHVEPTSLISQPFMHRNNGCAPRASNVARGVYPTS